MVEKIFEMYVAEVLDVGIARVNFKYLSVTSTIYQFFCAILDRGPRMFLAINCSSFEA